MSLSRMFKDMKHLIDIRPVRHTLAERIKAHVLPRWPGMLLIRIAEQETGQTWFRLKKHLSTLQAGLFKTEKPADVFKALNIKNPAKFLDFPKPLR